MKIDLSNANVTIPQTLTDRAETYKNQLFSGAMENTGWVDLPWKMNGDILTRIQETADEIAGKCRLFIVVAIGGSYLGAKAVIEALGIAEGSPDVVFVGNDSADCGGMLLFANEESYVVLGLGYESNFRFPRIEGVDILFCFSFSRCISLIDRRIAILELFVL